MGGKARRQRWEEACLSDQLLQACSKPQRDLGWDTESQDTQGEGQTLWGPQELPPAHTCSVILDPVSVCIQ